MIKEKQKSRLSELVPPLNELEGLFEFVADAPLRINLTIAIQYILVLIAIMDREEAEGTSIASSIHKNMIVNSATVAEGCLHYCLRRYIDSGTVASSDVMPVVEVNRDYKILHKISNSEDVCGVIRHKKTERFGRQTTYQVINRASQKAGILDKELFAVSEELRVRRNKIHLAGLVAVDDFYSKSTVNDALTSMSQIIKRVEHVLSEIEK